MSKFLVHVTTAWDGMDQSFAVIANSEYDLQNVAELAAYDNFSDFDCLQQVMDDEGIDEDAAAEIEHEYYGFYIEEWDETRPEEEWGWYELRWDFTNKSEMLKYRIFAGLGGGFGGATEYGIFEYKTKDDAYNDAYRLACEEYESYGGMHGLFNEEDALEENPDLSEDELDGMLQEDIDSWIEYWAVLVGSDEDTEIEDSEE